MPETQVGGYLYAYVVRVADDEILLETYTQHGEVDDHSVLGFGAMCNAI